MFSKRQLCQDCYIDAPYGHLLNEQRKSLTAITQECCKPYWISPGSNTPKNSSCTATNHSSWKLSKASWRIKDVLISNVFPWTLRHGIAMVVQAATTYILQLCADRGCSLEDLPREMDDWHWWRERVRDIYVSSATWTTIIIIIKEAAAGAYVNQNKSNLKITNRQNVCKSISNYFMDSFNFFLFV